MMRIKVILLLLLVLIGEVRFTYPIEPRPLRRLVMESKFIIVGFVEKVEMVQEPPISKKNTWRETYSLATIRIKEVLQGELIEKLIQLRFNPNMICPAPDMYFQNTHVVAFLDVDEKGYYYTHALSYGSKTLLPEAVAVYKARIIEMQDILKEQDKYKQFMATVAWLVKCAENTHTRWEGTYELSPSSDFMSFYDRSKSEDFSFLLSRDDRDRLRTVLLKQERLQYDDLGLVDLVYEGKNDEVYQLLLRSLKDSRENESYFVVELMTRLTYVNQGDEFKKLVKQYEECRYDSKSSDSKKILNEFIWLVER
jgi:hypothetical protein